MIQINPLKSYIDGGVRAAITTPPSASLVFDLPGKAIWVKGVKLKGTDHTYTFSHDNYITLANTPDSNESEDIKIGVNTSALKSAIDTTYGVVSTTANGLAPKFTSGNKQAATAATTYYFLGWTGTTLKWYQAPFRNIRINSETTDRLGVNSTDPLIISSGNGISVTWDSTNKKIIITNTKPDVNHNTDRTGIKLTTVSGTKKTDSTLILANSATGLNIQGGTNKFLIGDGTNYIEVPVTPSFTVSNKDAIIGTALTTIATIAGVDIKAKIASYSLSNHTHSVKINGSTKTIAASGAVDLGNYLPLSGGTMGGTAWIVWPDSGNISNNNEGVTFPVIRGGLEWRGQTDYIKLFSEETGRDNLNLVLQFGDDNSNGLSIRNKANTQTSYISSSGVITTGTFKGNLDWSYITNKPSSYTPSAHTHAWNSLTHSSTTENQAILTNGKTNGWKLYTLNISGWNNAANNAHSHSNKSVLDGITSTLVSNWNTAYTFVNTITGTDTDKVINKWDEIVNFLAGITEDNKLNTLLNSKLSIYKLADNTNVGAIKNNGIYYSTSDASSGTLINSPFNNGFTLINMTSLDNSDDLRRSRLAFNAYGEVKVSNDRGQANTAETWYNVLTSNNSGISGSTIKLNGTSITVYSSSTADGRYVKKAGDTMSGVLTIDTTGFGALTIKRNDDTNGASIQFRGKSSVYGYIGLNNSTKDKQFLRWNSDTSKTYTILDTSSTYTSNGKGVINGTTITQVDNATNSTNSTNAINARKLVNWYSTRPTSLNTQFGDGSLRIFYATSSTTEGKPAEDSHILHLAWDNTGGWDAQLAVHTRSGKISTRAQNSGTWQPWKTLALTTDIPLSLKNPYSLTTFGVVYDGSAAKVVSPSNFISQVNEAASTVTDGTMLITSYASNSGFADTNAVNVPYKRKAIHLWEYIKAKTDSLYATRGHNHDDRYLKLTGGTMTGSIAFSNSSYLLWNNGSYHQRIFLTDDSTADTAVFTFQQSSDSGVNWSNLMTIRDNGKVIANTFVGALQGNASTATKLTSSAGNAALPIYFSDGKPVACTASSIFSNLSNSGNNLSITVAGQNRTLTIAYASTTSKLISRGSLAAYEEGSTTKGESGVNLYTIYNNGYPVTYGNLLHINGSGAGQLLAEWCRSATLGHLYYRSKRDNSDNGWSAWGKVAFVTDNVATASKWITARKITLSGSITGSVSIDGSGDVTLATTTHHTHNWENIEGKPNTFTPSAHTHSYITISTCSTLNENSNNFSVEYASGSNSVATKPSGVDAFSVMKLRTASGWYGQILMSNSKGIYYRSANGLTSSVNWIKLLDSSNSSVSGGGNTWGSSITVNINGTSKTLTIPNNPNTDYRVTQSETTTANYRPLVVGYTNVSTAGSGMTGSVTNQVYLSNKFYVQPSTGNLYATNFVGTLSGNATTATTLQTTRTLWGQSFNGSANVSGNMSGVGQITFSTLTGTNGRALLYQQMADNDYFRIYVGGTASNSGYVEIATADDGNEPIYVRQYTGVFSTIKRTFTLLDGSGNTILPGLATATGFKKNGSTDNYVLLGGGGHKIISDFMLKGNELSTNLTTISKSLTVTQAWMDTGIKNTDLPANGTYIVQVSANNTADSIWSNYWSGIMSWYIGGTNDNEADEIILHRAGHAYHHTIYLRTIMTTSSDGRHLRLQIAADTNLSTAVTYTFKFKRVI